MNIFSWIFYCEFLVWNNLSLMYVFLNKHCLELFSISRNAPIENAYRFRIAYVKARITATHYDGVIRAFVNLKYRYVFEQFFQWKAGNWDTLHLYAWKRVSIVDFCSIRVSIMTIEFSFQKKTTTEKTFLSCIWSANVIRRCEVVIFFSPCFFFRRTSRFISFPIFVFFLSGIFI